MYVSVEIQLEDRRKYFHDLKKRKYLILQGKTLNKILKLNGNNVGKGGFPNEKKKKYV